MLKRIFLLTFLVYSYISLADVIIWDFGGILFQPDKLGVAKEIGLQRFISYLLMDWKNPNIEKLLYEVLTHVPSDYEPGPKEKNFNPAGSADGPPLPPIMCEWQAGTKTGPEIIKLAEKQIALLAQQNFFQSDREKELVTRTIQTMFNPHVLARNVYPVEEGVRLLKECAAVRDRNGRRKHRLVAFSNWDHLSFKSFYKRNTRVFKYFDHVVISGDIHRIKPYKNAFEYVIYTLRLNPNDCILIDDQKVNADGAKACGMKALLINGDDYDALRIELIKSGILSNS